MVAQQCPGSSSLRQPDYWWYRARTELLEVVLGPYVGEAGRVLDVGSADGPSVAWLKSDQRVAVDMDPRGLSGSEAVCASAVALPFADESFDVVGAFDVLEHCDPEQQAVREFTRVLRVGGRLLMSVPAYQWAWTEHDVRAGHHRRYTRRRLMDAVGKDDLRVVRCSYAFAGVFPFFAAERAMRRLKPPAPADHNSLPTISPRLERLFMRLSGLDGRVLRRRDLPFGSSVLIAAVKA
jgi:SAM-dependent methyltransferase